MTDLYQAPPVDPFTSVQPSDVSGIASIPFVMAGVDFLKAVLPFDRLPPDRAAQLYPFLTYLVAMVINCGIAAVFAADWRRGIAVGIVAGIGASGVRSQARAGMDTTGAAVAGMAAMLTQLQTAVAALRLPPAPPQPDVPDPVNPEAPARLPTRTA